MVDYSQWFWYPHRVTYQETDVMGVVYYANYLHWFEIGRTEFVRSKGIPYRLLEQKGIFLPVREAGCRYFRPAHYDEIVMIGCRIEKFGRASVTFGYEVQNEEKSLVLAKGFTQLASVDENARPVAFPEDVKNTLRMCKMIDCGSDSFLF